MRGDPERRNKKKGLHVLHRRRVSVLHASGSSRRSVRTEAEKTWEQMDDLLAGNEHAGCRIRASRCFFSHDVLSLGRGAHLACG